MLVYIGPPDQIIVALCTQFPIGNSPRFSKINQVPYNVELFCIYFKHMLVKLALLHIPKFLCDDYQHTVYILNLPQK